MRLFHVFVLVAFLTSTSVLTAQDNSNLFNYPTPSGITGKVDQVSELQPFKGLVDSLLITLFRGEADRLGDLLDGKTEEFEEYAGGRRAAAFCKAVSLADFDFFVSEKVILAIREAGYDQEKQKAMITQVLNDYMQGDKDRLAVLYFVVTRISKLVPGNPQPGFDPSWSFKIEAANLCEADLTKFGIARDFVNAYSASPDNKWLNSRVLALILKSAKVSKPVMPSGINGYVDTNEERDLIIAYLESTTRYYSAIRDFIEDSEAIFEQVDLICEVMMLLDIRFFGKEAEKYRNGYRSEEKLIQAVMEVMTPYVDENSTRFYVNVDVMAKIAPFVLNYIKDGKPWDSNPKVKDIFRQVAAQKGCLDRFYEFSNFTAFSVIYLDN